MKDIPNFEGRYAVTKDGRVWSHVSKKFMVPVAGKRGYLQVSLGRKVRAARIHRLVAQTFLPNPESLAEVNHKDGDNQNNNVENLEWCDRYENLLHQFFFGNVRFINTIEYARKTRS